MVLDFDFERDLELFERLFFVSFLPLLEDFFFTNLTFFPLDVDLDLVDASLALTLLMGVFDLDLDLVTTLTFLPDWDLFLDLLLSSLFPLGVVLWDSMAKAVDDS